MLWAEGAASAEPTGENELGRSGEQKGALVCEAGREGAGGRFTDNLRGHREASNFPQKVTAGVLSRGGLQADIC